MADLNDLANRMQKLKASLPDKASALACQVARVIQKDLVYVTPVDESTALSNWVLTVGEPWAVPLTAYYLGEQGSTQNQSARAALQQGEQQLALKKPGETIFITNNAAHIRALNDGSSAQAPAGFVERAVLLGRKVVESTGLQLKV
jgi:hypothetical protein